jgi:predicted metal-dependent enzyme (double-stranded beta helix superfamily)
MHVSSSSDLTPGLRFLVSQVDAACLATMDEMPTRMAAALAAVAGDAELVPEAARRSDPLRYTRHLLHADPLGRFAIVSLVWGPGQFSPVHGHHAWCAYAVQSHALTETRYLWDAGTRLAAPAECVRLDQGATSFAYAGLDAVHKLGNGGDNDALSIHIYGLDGARVGSHVNRLVGVSGTA